jgi:hypothetical protein
VRSAVKQARQDVVDAEVDDEECLTTQHTKEALEGTRD